MGRLLVVLAALCGLAAVVLPLMDISVNDGASRMQVSTLDLLRGVDALSDRAGESARDLDPAERTRLQGDIDQVKWIFAGFVGGPALLVLLVALASLAGMGRGKGVLALLFGLVALGAGALLSTAFDKANAERTDKATSFRSGIALTLLLATGGGAALGGLLSIVSPTRRDGA